GTGFEKIGSLKRGASIKGELLENGWIKFTMENGEVGYVSGKYVYLMEGEDCMDCEGSATVVCSTLNVRLGPDTSFDKIGKIKRGDTVYIVSCDATHSWYKIIWNDAHAWISAKYVYID
ncbi:MAG: SH3 domain-containing protein, partial [Clostridia bacterium]|nr:SH3 domain-containing protein [Clostridia bacterium]